MGRFVLAWGHCHWLSQVTPQTVAWTPPCRPLPPGKFMAWTTLAPPSGDRDTDFQDGRPKGAGTWVLSKVSVFPGPVGAG